MRARRRRAAVLLGLAALLGGLAASDVAQRERALEARLAPLRDVVVAARDLPSRRALRPGDLAVRRIPERFAPPSGAALVPGDLVGRRLAQPVAAGTFVSDGMLQAGAARPAGPRVARGERAAFVVGTAAPGGIVAGARVDVLVTRGGGEQSAAGRTELALEDVEVLGVAPVAGAEGDAAELPRVGATLRVTLPQAVYLAAAQDFARRVRLLPRAAGDRRRGGRLAVGAALR